MNKWIAMLLLLALTLPSMGLAQDMVSISELHAQAEALGGRWQGTYETKKGAVTVDAPIIVPDVDAIPVITIERAKPLTQEWFDELEAKGRTGKGKTELQYLTEVDGKDVEFFFGYEENGLNGYAAANTLWTMHGEYIKKWLLGPIEPRSYHHAWEIDPDQPFARDTDMTVNGAMALLRQDLKRYYPNEEIEVHPEDVEIKGSLLAKNSDKGKRGEYKLYYVEQYMHGVPIIGGIGWEGGGNHFNLSYTATKETNKKHDKLQAYVEGTKMSVPSINVFAQSEESYRVIADVSRLRSVEIADVPLASLNEVMANVQRLIEDGKVLSVASLRLGYLLYSNPEMTDHAWAVPRWVLDCEYTNNYDEEYQMPIDAQSGEPIVFTIGDEKTFSVPKMITWEDVN